MEHLIVDPPFDEWHLYRGLGVGTRRWPLRARWDASRRARCLVVVEADISSDPRHQDDLSGLGRLADLFVISNGRAKHNIIDDVKYVTRGIKMDVARLGRPGRSLPLS